MAAKNSLISGCVRFLIEFLNYLTVQTHFVQAGNNYK